MRIKSYRRLCLFLMLLLPVVIRGSAAECAVPGVVISGQVVVSQPGWDLSQIVVYLVPENHELNIAPPVEHLRVDQKNAQFSPPFLVAVKDQTVDFYNDDTIDHNVFSFSHTKKFDLGLYPKGQFKSVTFDKEGPVLYFCSIHENMNGILYVVPNELYGIGDHFGKFAIRNVPPGKYVVRTWHPALPESIKFLEVRSIDTQSGKPLIIKIDIGKGQAH